jgi:tRNA threonylcarbamoyladenosine modification (KEOPS) complex  Pcc1 subunit
VTDAVSPPEDADAGAGAATARLRTRHPRPAVVVAALTPDNTPQIDTRLVDGRVETVLAREDVAGLRATVQDYLRNLDAADRTVRAALAVAADRAEDENANADESDTQTHDQTRGHRQPHQRGHRDTRQ